jgi:hypothetical protein
MSTTDVVKFSDLTGRRVMLKRKGGVRRRLGREHWNEFGRTKLRGTVIGHPHPDWPEWDVRWDNGLRYAYKREHLVVLP